MVNEMQKATSLKDAILLASLFFSEFLLIHPFSNGNGRTARLLVNYLLRNHIRIPFSIQHERGTFIQVLESRLYDYEFPSQVADMFLFSVRLNYANLQSVW